MLQKTHRSKTYTDLSGGWVTSVNPFKLEVNQSPYILNYDLVKEGFKAKKGYEYRFSFPSWINITTALEYIYKQRLYLIMVSYPNIILLDTETFEWDIIYKKWLDSSGKPRGDQNANSFLLCDGKNPELIITGKTVSILTWPQQLSSNNDDIGNVGETIYSSHLNQRPNDMGRITNVLYSNGRFQVTEDRYKNVIFYSKLFDNFDFSANTPSDFDIAFFLEAPTKYPITAWGKLEEGKVAIYTTREIIDQKGSSPPGLNYPEQDWLSLKAKNTSVGAFSQELVQPMGTGDHLYFSLDGRLYTYKNAEDFDKARPKGLSDAIYNVFEAFTPDMWEQSRLHIDTHRAELLLFCPSDPDDGYCTQCIIFNYNQDINAWTRLGDFGPTFSFSAAFTNNYRKELYVINQGNRFLVGNTGFTFDGYPVKPFAELRPETFDYPERNKEVISIHFNGLSSTGAELKYKSLWENGEEGLASVYFKNTVTSEELLDDDEQEYNIVQGQGKSPETVITSIPNRVGLILRQFISSDKVQDLAVYLIAVVHEVLDVMHESRGLSEIPEEINTATI